MKKLKHDVKVGDRFFLDISVWECVDIPRGEYEIIEISEDNYFGCKVKQVNGGATYYMRPRNVKYFCGEEVEHEYNVAYDDEYYQPSSDDENDPDFRLEEEESDEFGFWSLSKRGDDQCISNPMLQSRFAWVKMPW